MGQLVELNQGEIKLKFDAPTKGKLTFMELGITNDQLALEGGFLRLVFDFEGIGEHDYFAVPTIEVAYKESCAETHWQCDFNEETIVDKMDYGHSTLILLDRKKLASLEHHHENKLIVHAEFPEPVHLIAADSYVNFFK